MRHNMEEVLNEEFAHIPVFWREVLHYVEEGPLGATGTFVDSTLGEGGHSELILKGYEDMNVIAFERDAEILEVAKKRLAPFGQRIACVHGNFSTAPARLEEEAGKIHYILYDFGISSFHFDRSGRGFSFQDEEPLDMRLDHSGESAADIVNTWREEDLGRIFKEYGEERYWRRVADKIVYRRKEKKITGTMELAEIVKSAIPHKPGKGPNIHPATRVFQALRIEVNDELGAIDRALRESYKYLAPGGRIMAISFHSLEDRIVKDRFRRLSKGCTCDLEPKHCQCSSAPFVKLVTKKPLVPEEDEIEVNRRSRSAKLRVVERL